METSKKHLKTSDYVHLHNHTQYSLLDGLTKVPALIEKVKQLGMESVAITDHGTLSGVIEFYTEARKNSIRPIIGMEGYVAARSYSEKDPAKDKQIYHLIILAMNQVGYKNLMRLSTIANLEGMYYKPRIDHDLLKRYNEGLIILSGCIGGEVGDLLRQGQYQQAKDVASWYKSVFKDRYYLEVQDHGHPKHPHKWQEQVDVNKEILKLADELKIDCVVTCDAHYLNHGDQEAHEILLCVQTGSFLSDEKRMSLANFDLHVTEPDDVIKRWGDERPDLITNTNKIAQRCNVEIDIGKFLIPKFSVPKGETEYSHLETLVYQGLTRRYLGFDENKAKKLTVASAKKALPKNIVDRAKYELSVVNSMNFDGYFLIIADFINWGKKRGIVFGPGRGSAAGSIIAYSLRITELDPLRYDLLFERFLNPDRISMPDIDIDIQDNRRDEVIQYCIDKYGVERVANIVTFGRMAARNAVRDVARVLQVPYAESDRLAKMIPPPFQGRHIPLEVSIREDTDLKAEYHNNPTAKKVFDLAIQLEGTIRSHGVHAAGVVIAPDDIVNFAPLELAQKGVVATQYSMNPIEELGLLKIDFLGLSNLTIIKNALRIIKKINKVDIDIANIPLDDKATFELLAQGNTTGVFQLESTGMKRYLRALKPTVFEDIIAMNALYRPGPMQFIDDFIARKNGLKEIKYLHEKMQNALENTYGILVYQEQVMQIAKDLCGFTGGQADTLRKGVAKKKPEVLAALKKDFIDGSQKVSDISLKKIEDFWRQLEAFAAYCFPKAHAASYAHISYWTAYLKAHYPAPYMAAVMSSDFDDTDRLAIEITECRHMGIEVLAPDVNESFLEFAVVPGENPTIRFGMNAIKNVGTGAVEEILRAREANGPFQRMEDFLEQVSSRVVNRKTMESLIKAGAFDKFEDRSILLHNLDGLTAYAGRLQKQTSNGQTDLFVEVSDQVSVKPRLSIDRSAEPVSAREELAWERELLGLYLSHHPLSTYADFLSRKTKPIASINEKFDGKTVDVGGSITSIREISTKNGHKMAFVKLEDQTAEIELVLFPNIYQQTVDLWQRDKVIIASGKASNRAANNQTTDDFKIMVDKAREITAEDLATAAKLSDKDSNEELKSERVYIRIPDSKNQQVLLALKEVIDKFRGETEVVLVLGDDDRRQAIKLPSKINNQKEVISSLMETVGAKNVKVK
jgi:DNA polymerase-3 subunit alpha